MSRWFGALAALSEDPNSTPSSHIRQLTTSELPITPAPRDQMLSSEGNTHTHTQIHVCKNIRKID